MVHDHLEKKWGRLADIVGATQLGRPGPALGGSPTISHNDRLQPPTSRAGKTPEKVLRNKVDVVGPVTFSWKWSLKAISN